MTAFKITLTAYYPKNHCKGLHFIYLRDRNHTLLNIVTDATFINANNYRATNLRRNILYIYRLLKNAGRAKTFFVYDPK